MEIEKKNKLKDRIGLRRKNLRTKLLYAEVRDKSKTDGKRRLDRQGKKKDHLHARFQV